MKNLTSRQLITIATLVSVVSIAGAWTFQSLGYTPCHLCYLQRYPHYAAIAIGVVALAFGWRWLAWAGAAAAATTSAIGFYHSGVERHWWPGPTSCTGTGNLTDLSPADLLNQITAAPFVPCDQIPWSVSDLIAVPPALDWSMANFNAVGALITAFIWIAAARRA